MDGMDARPSSELDWTDGVDATRRGGRTTGRLRTQRSQVRVLPGVPPLREIRSLLAWLAPRARGLDPVGNRRRALRRVRGQSAVLTVLATLAVRLRQAAYWYSWWSPPKMGTATTALPGARSRWRIGIPTSIGVHWSKPWSGRAPLT
jgi:hypothetical protein